MSADPRDIHFAGFAKMLLQDLMTKFDHLPLGEWGPAEADELIIARRAYDLVLHAVTEVSIRDLESLHSYETTERIPDLTPENIAELDMFRRKTE